MNVKMLRFSVKGEGGHIFVVRAAMAPRTVTLTCSCGSDARIDMCSHRNALLHCDPSVLAGKNVDDIEILADAAQRTDCARWFAIARRYTDQSAQVRADLDDATSRYCAITGHSFGPAEADADGDAAVLGEGVAEDLPEVVAICASAAPLPAVAPDERQPNPIRRFYPPPLRAPPIIGKLKTAPLPVRTPIANLTATEPAAVPDPAGPAAPILVPPVPPQAKRPPPAHPRVQYAAMARAAITEAKSAWARGEQLPAADIRMPHPGGPPNTSDAAPQTAAGNVPHADTPDVATVPPEPATPAAKPNAVPIFANDEPMPEFSRRGALRKTAVKLPEAALASAQPCASGPLHPPDDDDPADAMPAFLSLPPGAHQIAEMRYAS